MPNAELKPILACFALVVLATSVSQGFAEPCSECGAPGFPEASAFLAAQGYSPEQYTVLLAWTEAARTPDKPLVRGYHLLLAGTTEPFDLYSDCCGHLLDSGQLKALGIAAKDWDLAPLSVAAETAVPGPKEASLAPRPVGTTVECETPELLQLPPLDLEAVLEEDAAGTATPGKGVTRIGVFQVFPEPVVVAGGTATHGAWQDLPDGSRLWSVDLYSPDAMGERVHFEALDLPAGAQVIVYNAYRPAEAYGPFTSIPEGDADLWSPTCFSDLVTVECHVPSQALGRDLELRIDRIAHMYRELGSLPWKAADWCNLDVACDTGDWPEDTAPSEWAAAARGVAGIGTIGASGTLWCTGSLLADVNPATSTPYFLTANHCVGSQKAHSASSCEFYWLYQRPACGEDVPNAVDVPRTTGGADLLATTNVDTGTDFCLLRLRHNPPSGLTFLGWKTGVVSVGSEVACIHHPRGDYKRISFGTLMDYNDTCRTRQPAARFHQVLWHHGTTEGGSSGSPMMLRDTQQVIGQLWGGAASCSSPDCPDYYGRFDVTFPIIKSWLVPYAELPVVAFGAAAVTVSEGGGEAALSVMLDHAPGSAVSVQYTTADETAAAGKDYVATTGTLTFVDAETTKSATIPIINDTHHEWDKTFRVSLSNPQGCTLAAANTAVAVEIVDDDIDTDGDTLSDYDELNETFGYLTSPYLRDTDDDGYDDNVEIDYGYSPSDPSSHPQLSALHVPFFK